VRARVHGEHGRDIEDMHGLSRRHRWMRRLHRPFVQHWVALSGELQGYLHDAIGVPAARVTRICNGVDDERFAPAPGGGRQPIAGSPFNDPRLWLLGTVGRMQTVKAQPLLVQAFAQALREQPALADRTRLVLVGDGPLRAEAEAQAAAAGIAPLVWFAGERGDVPDVMRGLDCFVLPSLAEGISNTILEAMASALPVLATRVGGNAELVADAETGEIVPPGDVAALAAAIRRWAADPARAVAAGQAGRRRVAQQFSLGAMVAAYEGVYRRVLGTTTTE
jgi:sugar transferase (PEP-CTERM/EpsH1 system associated)